MCDQNTRDGTSTLAGGYQLITLTQVFWNTFGQTGTQISARPFRLLNNPWMDLQRLFKNVLSGAASLQLLLNAVMRNSVQLYWYDICDDQRCPEVLWGSMNYERSLASRRCSLRCHLTTRRIGIPLRAEFSPCLCGFSGFLPPSKDVRLEDEPVTRTWPQVWMRPC